jgi:hypothetical protein
MPFGFGSWFESKLCASTTESGASLKMNPTDWTVSTAAAQSRAAPGVVHPDREQESVHTIRTIRESGTRADLDALGSATSVDPLSIALCDSAIESSNSLSNPVEFLVSLECDPVIPDALSSLLECLGRLEPLMDGLTFFNSHIPKVFNFVASTMYTLNDRMRSAAGFPLTSLKCFLWASQPHTCQCHCIGLL